MLGQEGNKVIIKGTQAKEVRVALARSLSTRLNENEQKPSDSRKTRTRKTPQIEWE